MFELEKYNGKKSRFKCPSCKQDYQFTRYIEKKTGRYVDESVGICNRKINCGYHYSPWEFFKDRDDSDLSALIKPEPITRIENLPVYYFNWGDVYCTTLNGENNNLSQFLINRFDKSTILSLINKYHIGTSNRWPGSTIFWQIDNNGKIRTGKIMHYNVKNGRRTKIPYDHIDWVHRAFKLNEKRIEQCLFGQHLIHNNDKLIGVVESEKTAIVASIYFPDILWLATGGIANLSKQKIEPLRNRKVIFFPDLKAYDQWETKIKEFSTLGDFRVSDLLIIKAANNEKDIDTDIADYLI
jgi:hypothetical protein